MEVVKWCAKAGWDENTSWADTMTPTVTVRCFVHQLVCTSFNATMWQCAWLGMRVHVPPLLLEVVARQNVHHGVPFSFPDSYMAAVPPTLTDPITTFNHRLIRHRAASIFSTSHLAAMYDTFN